MIVRLITLKIAARGATHGDNETHIEIIFEAETIHSVEMQRTGWQAILENVKRYVEEKHHDKS